MNVTSSSTARRRAAFAFSRSGGSPQMPVPVRRIAPKPIRFTVRSPPRSMVPAAAAVVSPAMCCLLGSADLPDVEPGNGATVDRVVALVDTDGPIRLQRGHPVFDRRLRNQLSTTRNTYSGRLLSLSRIWEA